MRPRVDASIDPYKKAAAHKGPLWEGVPPQAVGERAFDLATAEF